MFDFDIKKLSSDIILDPYQLKDIRLLVIAFRQYFLNSVIKILDHKQLHGGLNYKETKLHKIYKEIHQNRILLDDLERALEVAENNDYMQNEKREFFLWALSESESKDDIRYEEIIEREGKDVKNMTEKDVLIDISKRLRELYYMIHKIRNQQQRREEWDSYGPPASLKTEFEKYINAENAEPINPSDAKSRASD